MNERRSSPPPWYLLRVVLMPSTQSESPTNAAILLRIQAPAAAATTSRKMLSVRKNRVSSSHRSTSLKITSRNLWRRAALSTPLQLATANGVSGPTLQRLRRCSWTLLPGAFVQLIGSTKFQARLEVKGIRSTQCTCLSKGGCLHAETLRL